MCEQLLCNEFMEVPTLQMAVSSDGQDYDLSRLLIVYRELVDYTRSVRRSVLHLIFKFSLK